MADLWPLALMRARAGAVAPAAEVVRAASPEQVAAALRSGRRVVPLGGGSGVCGAVAPEAGDVVLDLGGLNGLEIDAPNLLARAGAGLNGLELERRLNARGLTLGHYPSSLPVATVGGLISTRSSGQESSRYGSVEDMVQGLSVMLADGTLLEARPGPRSAAGPALHQLFVGAEGGLGIVLAADLRLHRRPEAVIGSGWRLPDVGTGLELMREVVQAGLRPLVLRLYDPDDTAFQGVEGGCLMVAAAAGPRPVAAAEAAVMAGLAAGAGAEDLGEAPWRRWLEHRFDLSAERLRDFLEPPGAFLDTVEVATTWTALPGLYTDVRQALLESAAFTLCHFSHAGGQGCCAYFTFAGSAPDEAAAEAAYTGAWRSAMEATLRRGAVITHHHGVGRQRAPWVAGEMGAWLSLWSQVRSALDPDARLNPGALGGGRP